MKNNHYIYIALRSIIAISLLAVLCLQIAIRLTGYVHCMVTAYVIEHRDITVDCGCVHYIAQTFDEGTSRNQLQQMPSPLKLQDYVPAGSTPLLQTPECSNSRYYGVAPQHYQYTAVSSIFHPPSAITTPSLFSFII